MPKTKIALALSVMLTVTGCSTVEYALKPISWVADDICDNRTDNQIATIAEQVDKATHPHVVRVQCYEQVKTNE